MHMLMLMLMHMLMLQPDAHVVGVPLLTGVAQRGVELDHLVVAVEGDLA